MTTLRLDDVSWTQTEVGDVVVLDLRTSKYFGLNGSGAALWTALADGASREQLRDRLTSTYGLDAERAERDVTAFLERLAALGLTDAGS